MYWPKKVPTQFTWPVIKPPNKISAFAPAKINLALHVTGRRLDGLHLLDSLVVFGDIGDTITALAADTLSLSVTGPMATGVPLDEGNLVLRAAKLLHDLRDVQTGATIHLEKILPHGAGIGGGSADAAATIRALAQLWDVAPLTGLEATPLGADLPVCLCAPTPTLMRGIGDDLTPTPTLPPLWLVLVNPGIHVNTGKVFGILAEMFDSEDPPLAPMHDVSEFHDFTMWLLGQSNSLTKCTAELCPEIAEIMGTFFGIEECEDCDMSGSGSTCWGLFETRNGANAAAAKFTGDHPDWWVKAVRVLS